MKKTLRLRHGITNSAAVRPAQEEWSPSDDGDAFFICAKVSAAICALIADDATDPCAAYDCTIAFNTAP